jgi:hypothetical protein
VRTKERCGGKRAPWREWRALIRGAFGQKESEPPHADCLWDYVLSDVGQDCFPLWFEVEEDGQKSVVMGAVLYFPIGEHSEEETAPRREVFAPPKSENTACRNVRRVGARRERPQCACVHACERQPPA